MSSINNIVTGRLSSIATVTSDAEITGLDVGTVESTGNITFSGNISGSYVLGNGRYLSGLNPTNNYSDSNVEALLAGGTLSSNIVTTGTISGSYLVGNGSQLTGISSNPSSYYVQPTFSGGATSGMAGTWFQQTNAVTLPPATDVPTGSFYYFTQAGGATSITVNDTNNEFIYYPPQFGSTNRSVTPSSGQYAFMISRGPGTTEWDMIATNIQQTQTVSCPANSTYGTIVSMDGLNFQVQNNNGVYVSSDAPFNQCYWSGTKIQGGTGSQFVSSASLSSSLSSMVMTLTSAGDGAIMTFQSQLLVRTYRVVISRPGSSQTFGISVQRLMS